MKINPLCFRDDSFFFVKPDGTYLPCCYASSNKVFRTMLGEETYSELNLTNHSFEEVINSSAWKKIIEIVKSDNPPGFCKDTCSRKEEENRTFDENNVYFDGANKQRAF